MPHLEDSFKTDDGLILYECGWLPDDEPAAVLVLVHGAVEHCGRYAEMAQVLNRHGVAVYGFDLRGHGRSEGDRIWVNRFDRYVADLATYVDRIRDRHPNVPRFLFGHSMGGTIAGLFALQRPDAMAGLVLSAPALVVSDQRFPLLRRLAAVGSVLFPRLRLVKLGGSMMSSDPEVVAQFQADPLVFHGRIPTKTGYEILQAGKRLLEQSKSLTVPFLILHGTADVVSSPDGSRELHTRSESTDKTLKFYDDLYHDLPREPKKEQIFADMAAWLAR
jgi:acylglycerol lipase